MFCFPVFKLQKNCPKKKKKRRKRIEVREGESRERKCFKVIRVHKRFPEKMKWIYCYLSNTKATICQYWLWLWWILLIRTTLYIGEENQTRKPKPSYVNERMVFHENIRKHYVHLTEGCIKFEILRKCKTLVLWWFHGEHW